MSGISTHVLDTALGTPAAGVRVGLTGPDGRVHGGVTDVDGRVGELVPGPLVPGVHRVVFDTGAYFAGTGQPAFYPEVDIAFTVRDQLEHYHVPLLLSPFGYSTYRGS